MANKYGRGDGTKEIYEKAVNEWIIAFSCGLIHSGSQVQRYFRFFKLLPNGQRIPTSQSIGGRRECQQTSLKTCLCNNGLQRL